MKKILIIVLLSALFSCKAQEKTISEQIIYSQRDSIITIQPKEIKLNYTIPKHGYSEIKTERFDLIFTPSMSDPKEMTVTVINKPFQDTIKVNEKTVLKTTVINENTKYKSKFKNLLKFTFGLGILTLLLWYLLAVIVKKKGY